jgi:hypothetical protein
MLSKNNAQAKLGQAGRETPESLRAQPSAVPSSEGRRQRLEQKLKPQRRPRGMVFSSSKLSKIAKKGRLNYLTRDAKPRLLRRSNLDKSPERI